MFLWCFFSPTLLYRLINCSYSPSASSMGFLKKLGVVSLATAGTLAAFSYKPKWVDTPQNVINHSYKWNPNHHQVMEDTHELKVAKDDIKEKDFLVGSVKGYFSSVFFKPQLLIMKAMKDEKTAKKELWEMENMKREDLQVGNFLFDHFEVLEVAPKKVWLRYAIGVVMIEVEEGEKDVVIKMSSVIWDDKENKPATPAIGMYLHLLYQRLLMQNGAKYM